MLIICIIGSIAFKDACIDFYNISIFYFGILLSSIFLFVIFMGCFSTQTSQTCVGVIYTFMSLNLAIFAVSALIYMSLNSEQVSFYNFFNICIDYKQFKTMFSKVCSIIS